MGVTYTGRKEGYLSHGKPKIAQDSSRSVGYKSQYFTYMARILDVCDTDFVRRERASDPLRAASASPGGLLASRDGCWALMPPLALGHGLEQISAERVRIRVMGLSGETDSRHRLELGEYRFTRHGLR